MNANSTSIQPPTAKTVSGGQRPRDTVVRRLLPLFLGLLAPAAFIVGAEPFAVRGRTSIKEIVGGCVAVALYLAICQFLVARKRNRGLGAIWPTLVAMIAPLMVMVVVIALVEKSHTVLVQGLPMLISGCFGSLAGAVLAGRIKRQADANPTQG